MDNRYLVAIQVSGVALMFGGLAVFSLAFACVVLGVLLLVIGETRR